MGSAPTLVSWTLNMSSLTAEFTFSEVIVGAEFKPQFINIQPSATVGSPGAVTLSDGTAIARNASTVMVQFTQQSGDQLKENTAFATASTSAATYAVITSGNIGFDMAGNSINVSSVGIPASSVENDAIAPILERFGFNVTSGVLSLVFSEVVQTSKLNVSRLALQNEKSRTSSTSFIALSDGEVSGGVSTTAEVKITSNALNAIKADRALCTNSSNTFLVAGQDTVLDQSNLGSVEITDQDALPVTPDDFSSDTSRPNLLKYIINLDLGTVDLFWSEAVDPATLNPEKLRISGN